MDAHPRRPSGAGSSAGQATSRPPPHVAENARSISPISHASPGLHMSSLPRRGSAATHRRGGSKRPRSESPGATHRVRAVRPELPRTGVHETAPATHTARGVRTQHASLPAGSVPGEPHGDLFPLADSSVRVCDEARFAQHVNEGHFNRAIRNESQWAFSTSPKLTSDDGPTPPHLGCVAGCKRGGSRRSCSELLEPARPELPLSSVHGAVPLLHAANHVRQYCPTEWQHVSDRQRSETCAHVMSSREEGPLMALLPSTVSSHSSADSFADSDWSTRPTAPSSRACSETRL